jgi:hypothetical protein
MNNISEHDISLSPLGERIGVRGFAIRTALSVGSGRLSGRTNVSEPNQSPLTRLAMLAGLSPRGEAKAIAPTRTATGAKDYAQ